MKSVLSLSALSFSAILIFLAGCCSATCPNIITRQKWGAKQAITVEYVVKPVEYIVVSHTVTSTCSTQASCGRILSSTQQEHINLGYDDIGFGFLIGGDGLIFEGRGWRKQGAHTVGYNKRSIGIAFIGNFDEIPASDVQIRALKDLIQCGKDEGELKQEPKLIGQRQVINTISPGLALYQQLQDLPDWVEHP